MSRITTAVSHKIRNSVRRAKESSGISAHYRVGPITIDLPATHRLPDYQAAHPRYDRFLPLLAKVVGPSKTIIDVGANCGDTLAALYAANPAATYICVEPDDGFFGYLVRNTEAIKSYDPSASITLVKALAGRAIAHGALAGTGGTKHVVSNADGHIAGGGIVSKTLDEMLTPSQWPNVGLLKTDVDGFDYDVLDSAAGIIKTAHPIIFFECFFEYPWQKDGYARLVSTLAADGYTDWVIFDNLGNVILKTADHSIVLQMLTYLENGNFGYFDICVYTVKMAEVVQQALTEHQAS